MLTIGLLGASEIAPAENAHLESARGHVPHLRGLAARRGERETLTVTGIVFPAAGHTCVLNIDGVQHVESVAGRETYDHQLDALVSHLSADSALPTAAVDAVVNMRAVDLIRNAAGESTWQ